MENTVTERSNRPGYGDDGRGVFFFPARVPFWLAPILCVGLLMAACSSPEQPRELTGAGSVVPADAVPVLSIVGATTDNYKWFYNTNVPEEDRSSLNFSAVKIGSQSLVLDRTLVPGTPSGEVLAKPSDGLPLMDALTGARAGYLQVDPVPDLEQGCCFQPTYRAFDNGVMGFFVAIKRSRFQTYPIDLGVRVVKDGVVQASTTIRYAYDPAVAAMYTQSTSPEYKGPGGRWQVAGTKTPLDWPTSVVVAPTSVTPNVATPLQVTPKDNIGLPLPLYSGPISLEWSPSGAGRPTTAPGTGPRDISVNLPEGSYQVTASTTCDVVCAPSTTTTINAAPAAVYRPDGLIKPAGAGPYIGNGVYNRDGTDQTLAAAAPAGERRTFSIRVENDGSHTDSFSVVGGAGGGGFTSRYFAGSTDITAEVVAGSYGTGDLAPGDSRVYRMVVKSTLQVAPGTVKRWYVHAVSYQATRQVGLNIRDTVGLRLRVQ